MYRLMHRQSNRSRGHPHLGIQLLEVVVVLTPDHVGQLMDQSLPYPIIAPEAFQIIRAQAQRDFLP